MVFLNVEEILRHFSTKKALFSLKEICSDSKIIFFKKTFETFDYVGH